MPDLYLSPAPYMLDQRAELPPPDLDALVPGLAVPTGSTVRMAEVTAGVWRAEVYDQGGGLLGECVRTDPGEAVRLAIGRARGTEPPESYPTPWSRRPRDWILGVGVGILVAIALALRARR